MSIRKILWAAFLANLLAARSADSPVQHTASLQTEELRAVVADNEPYAPDHRAGYSGVSELSIAGIPRRNLFVSSYSGLNFEHVFSGDATSFGWDIFEPRRAPLQLAPHSDRRVELTQERTAHWPLRSSLTYELNGNGVDFGFRATPLADAWRKHGYIGLFFASYIHAPENMSIQFIGRHRPGHGDPRPRWIEHLPPRHGVAANHRPAGSTWDPPLDEGFNIALVKGISDYEYLYPFYFGRSGPNVLIMMFQRSPEGGEIRFAQSPSGGGRGNPAWDFVYFQRDYAVSREFGFNARAVYKTFVSQAEVVRIYEEWSGETVSLDAQARVLRHRD